MDPNAGARSSGSTTPRSSDRRTSVTHSWTPNAVATMTSGVEVQALLSRAESAETFLNRPAADIAAQMFSQPEAPVLTGLRFGVYEVEAR